MPQLQTARIGNLTWPAQDRLPPEGPKSLHSNSYKTLETTIISRAQILDSAAPIGLGHIDIAFGIDRQSVAVGKFTDLVTRPPEACDYFSASMVENFDLLIAAVIHVHVFLLTVGRKADPPRGTPIIGKAVSSLDPDIILKFPILSNTWIRSACRSQT